MSERYTYERLVQDFKVQGAERLAYIDFLLRFKGGLSRSDLSDFFGIGDAAVSKEISEYKNLRENNVDYDRAQRRNAILHKSFEPLIDIDAETALGMLANGFNKNKLQDKPMIPYERIGALPRQLNVDIVSKVARAISCQTGIKCVYLSGSSPNHSERTLFPTAIFYDGLTWMFRAFHREEAGRNIFKCFNFSRLTRVEELPLVYAKQNEKLENDKDWHLITPIQIQIHPDLDEKRKAAVRQEFGLEENKEELIVNIKAVLFYYMALQWKIDVRYESKSEENKSNLNYNFHLMNRQTLEHLDCMENVFKYF